MIEIRKIKNKVTDYVNRAQQKYLLYKALQEVDAVDHPFITPLLTNVIVGLNQQGQSTFSHKQQMVKINVAIYKSLKSVQGIVGMQPLPGPCGLVYRLQYTGMETNTLRLEIVRDTATAKSRKLTAKWNIEATQDLKTLHDIDVEKEIVSVLGSEIAEEITRDVLYTVADMAPNRDLVNIDVADPHNYTTLLFAVNRLASNIAVKTRRGAGNIIITTPQVAALLQLIPLLTFKAADEPPTNHILSKVGTLVGDNLSRPVYTIYTTVDQSFISPDGDVLLVMYKGDNAVDTGVVYAPYKLCDSSGVMVDSTTFTPQLSFITRGDVVMAENAKEYVRALRVKPITINN